MAKKPILPDWEDMYGNEESKNEGNKPMMLEDLTLKQALDLVERYGLTIIIKKEADGKATVTFGGENTVVFQTEQKQEEDDDEIDPIIRRSIRPERNRTAKFW